MKMCISLLILFCLAGCRSRTVHSPNEHRLSAQSEWAFACAQLGVSSVADPPGAETVPAPMDEPVGTSPTPPEIASPGHGIPSDDSGAVPTICAYAPEWSADSREFLEWYHSPGNNSDSLTGFTLKLVSDEEIPDNLTKYPAFTSGDKAIVGWDGIDDLKERLGQLSGNSEKFEGRRDREPKREHAVPIGTVNQAEILPLLIGDGLTLTRSGPEVTIPLGNKVALVMPSGMQISASHSGDEMILSIEAGNPVIRLPWIGRLWPIKVEGMRLSGDTLTVELDGWKDYQIKVLP